MARDIAAKDVFYNVFRFFSHSAQLSGRGRGAIGELMS